MSDNPILKNIGVDEAQQGSESVDLPLLPSTPPLEQGAGISVPAPEDVTLSNIDLTQENVPPPQSEFTETQQLQPTQLPPAVEAYQGLPIPPSVSTDIPFNDTQQTVKTTTITPPTSPGLAQLAEDTEYVGGYTFYDGDIDPVSKSILSGGSSLVSDAAEENKKAASLGLLDTTQPIMPFHQLRTDPTQVRPDSTRPVDFGGRLAESLEVNRPYTSPLDVAGRLWNNAMYFLALPQNMALGAIADANNVRVGFMRELEKNPIGQAALIGTRSVFGGQPAIQALLAPDAVTKFVVRENIADTLANGSNLAQAILGRQYQLFDDFGEKTGAEGDTTVGRSSIKTGYTKPYGFGLPNTPWYRDPGAILGFGFQAVADPGDIILSPVYNFIGKRVSKVFSKTTKEAPTTTVVQKATTLQTPTVFNPQKPAPVVFPSTLKTSTVSVPFQIAPNPSLLPKPAPTKMTRTMLSQMNISPPENIPVNIVVKTPQATVKKSVKFAIYTGTPTLANNFQPTKLKVPVKPGQEYPPGTKFVTETVVVPTQKTSVTKTGEVVTPRVETTPMPVETFTGIPQSNLPYRLAQPAPGGLLSLVPDEVVVRTTDDLNILSRYVTDTNGETPPVFTNWDDVSKFVEKNPQFADTFHPVGVPVPGKGTEVNIVGTDTIAKPINVSRINDIVPITQAERAAQFLKKATSDAVDLSKQTAVRMLEFTDSFSKLTDGASASKILKYQLAQHNISQKTINEKLIKYFPNVGRQAILEEIPDVPTVGFVYNKQLVDYLSVETPKGGFYHGTRTNLQMADPISVSSGGSWGTGLYLTTDKDYATTYATAGASRNVPPVASRTYNESGMVYGGTFSDARLLPNQLPVDVPKQIYDVFRSAARSVLDDSEYHQFSRWLTTKKPNQMYEMYNKFDEIGAKNFTWNQVRSIQYQRNVNKGLRGLGFDGITDGVDAVLFDSNKFLVNETTGVPKQSLLNQQIARFNADSISAARYPTVVSLTNFYESSGQLNTKMVNDLRNLIEQVDDKVSMSLADVQDMIDDLTIPPEFRLKNKEERAQQYFEKLTKQYEQTDDLCGW